MSRASGKLSNLLNGGAEDHCCSCLLSDRNTWQLVEVKQTTCHSNEGGGATVERASWEMQFCGPRAPEHISPGYLLEMKTCISYMYYFLLCGSLFLGIQSFYVNCVSAISMLSGFGMFSQESFVACPALLAEQINPANRSLCPWLDLDCETACVATRADPRCTGRK